ncbi:MAG: tRNA (adenosine(37)-N6)-dimethylallyltransferase MiaA [Firmicutes bacterium]|nr:tRNA (adenosine(37)-N6)-dimethylallyltransferase MiaA [Bacillota bacterium]
MSRLPLLVLVGPTAVGKTQLSLRLAEELDGEIVSADSMQVYKFMDIGTAKPTPEERRRIPHYLLDVCLPNESFSVARYQRLAWDAIANIHRRGRFPILTGGTGLYVQAVVDGLNFPPQPSDKQYRAKLQALAQEEGPEAVHRLLQRVDPETASRIHPNNLRRVVRALEICRCTGRPMSAHLKEEPRQKPPYDLHMYGLTRDRSELYERINRRVDEMIAAGLVAEVKVLVEMGFAEGKTALQALGYKEILAYLQGLLTFEEAVELLKRDTRRYAKRQLTWFRRDRRIRWFNLSEITVAQVITTITQDMLKALAE